MDVLSKMVSAVRTTAGSMIRKGTVWIRRAKRMVARFAIRSDNLGIQFESGMASSGHTWGHLKRSPHYRGGSFSRTQPKGNSSPTCILPSDTARKMRWTSTGYSRSKIHSILCMRCGSISRTSKRTFSAESPNTRLTWILTGILSIRVGVRQPKASLRADLPSRRRKRNVLFGREHNAQRELHSEPSQSFKRAQYREQDSMAPSG